VKILVSLAVLSARLAAQQAGVAGTVVDQTNGKPLERVHITLMTGKPENSGQVYGALSDSAGHFSIGAMYPGVYQIVAQRSGYVQAPAAAKRDTTPSISLKAGQPVPDLKVEMARSSMVVGRVVDQNGDPVAPAGVQLVPLRPASMMPASYAASDGQTDERGEFRLLAGPGKYYLLTTKYGPDPHGPPEIRTDGTSEPVYASTYYPNSLTKDRATLLEILAGRDVAGLEIHLALAAVQRFLTVSGTVTGLPQGGPAFLVAMWAGGEEQMMAPVNGQVEPDGKFSLSGLRPGSYDLVVEAPFSKTRMEGRKRIKLDSDMGNVEIAAGQPGELTGTVVLTGLPAAKRTVRLVPAQGNMFFSDNSAPSGDLEQDGSFHLRNVRPGRYNVAVDPLPDTAYFKTVTLDGTVIAGFTIELTGGARVPYVKIILALDGAVISGRVLDGDGEVVAQDWMTVYLLTEPTHSADAPRTSLQEGKFTFKGIPPGKYRLVVFNPAQFYRDDAAAQEETFAKLFAAAEEIEMHAGDRISKDLKPDAKQQ